MAGLAIRYAPAYTLNPSDRVNARRLMLKVRANSTARLKRSAIPAGNLHGQRDHEGTLLRKLMEVGDVLEPMKEGDGADSGVWTGAFADRVYLGSGVVSTLDPGWRKP